MPLRVLAAREIEAQPGYAKEHDEQAHQNGILQNEPEANSRHQAGDEKRRKAAQGRKGRAADADGHQRPAEPRCLLIVRHSRTFLASSVQRPSFRGQVAQPRLRYQMKPTTPRAASTLPMTGQAGRRKASETPERMSSGIPQQRKWSTAKSAKPNPLLLPFAMHNLQGASHTANAACAREFHPASENIRPVISLFWRRESC